MFAIIEEEMRNEFRVRCRGCSYVIESRMETWISRFFRAAGLELGPRYTWKPMRERSGSHGEWVCDFKGSGEVIKFDTFFEANALLEGLISEWSDKLTGPDSPQKLDLQNRSGEKISRGEILFLIILLILACWLL